MRFKVRRSVLASRCPGRWRGRYATGRLLLTLVTPIRLMSDSPVGILTSEQAQARFRGKAAEVALLTAALAGTRYEAPFHFVYGGSQPFPRPSGPRAFYA